MSGQDVLEEEDVVELGADVILGEMLLVQEGEGIHAHRRVVELVDLPLLEPTEIVAPVGRQS